MMGTDVRAVVVIPAYGQPWLTAETLHTAVAQQTDFDFAVVVVNDGCPSPETHEICLNFAASYPGKVFYLKKANDGLSAARNSGIEFALSAFPTLEAVYFLDCDNHIGPLLLQRMVDALRSADETIGWAYADVDRFGFASLHDTSGAYSPLEHLFRSICEAGSMVSRRMLDTGIRFDTAMRKGVEDWDFWLQGLAKGFHGIHVADAGFRYRRRGESMLTEVERDIEPILNYIRQKHAQLYNVKAVLNMEIDARSRYAVYHPDTGLVRCMTAAQNDELVPLDSYIVRLLRAAERPAYGQCPGHLILMNQMLYDALAEERMLAGMLWALECSLTRATNTSCTLVAHTSASSTLSWRSVSANRLNAQHIPSPPESAQILAIEVGALLAHHFPEGGFTHGNHWHTAKPLGGRFFDLQIGCANRIESHEPAVESMANLRQRISEVAARKSRPLWHATERDRHRAQATMPRDLYPELFNVQSVFPAAAEGRSMAFVLDNASPASVALAARLGKWSQAEGHVLHLVSFGDRFAGEPVDLDMFAEIVSLPLTSLSNGTEPPPRQSYLGTDLPLLNGHDRQAALATLAAYSTVVSVGSSVLHMLAGALRHLKVETWAFLEANEGRASDAVTACSAFEQGYDAVFPETQEILHLCRAIGIPPRKLRQWPPRILPLNPSTLHQPCAGTSETKIRNPA